MYTMVGDTINGSRTVSNTILKYGFKHKALSYEGSS